MVKYPRYIFRSTLALQLIRDRVPGDSKFLEVGCADGELSSRIAQLGLTGDIFDLSEDAVRKAKELVKKEKLERKLNVYKTDLLTYKTAMHYDLVIILEVLEHIENEEKALHKVNALLKQGGYLLISVPAKRVLWGASDELVGHFRRYEKEELKDKLRQQGFEILKIYSYGFPLLNIIKLFRDFMAEQKIRSTGKVGKRQRTKKSGLNPIGISLLEILPILNRYTLFPFIKLSNLFNNYDLAEGYLCLARKERQL